MTSNHFLFVILYFLSNFFLFIAEASANTDQELKTKFFNDQCQAGCSPEFKACYQKISVQDRNAIMNDLIGRKVLQKVQTVEGSGFYNFGSETIPAATAKTEFNKAVGFKCQSILAAEAKATQAQVAKSSGSSSSGKSGGGSGGGDLLNAAKDMAPVVGAIPGVKAVVDKAKDKAKEVVSDVTGFKWGNANVGSAVNEAIDKTNQSVAASAGSTPSGNIGSVNDAVYVPEHLKSSVPQPTATPSVANQNSVPVDSTGQQVAPNYNVEKPTMSPTEGGIKASVSKSLDNSEMAKSEKALSQTPAANEASATKNPDNAATPDPTAETAKATATKEAQQTQTELESAIGQMETTGGGLCSGQVAALSEASKKYVVSKQTCGSDSASADNFCNTMRSPKALDVQKMISAGTAVLSKATAASESCGIMGNLSTLANGGMLAAQAVCSGYKFKCDFSCGDAKKEVGEMKTKNDLIASCLSVERQRAEALAAAQQIEEANMLRTFINQLTVAQQKADQIIVKETPAVDPNIAQCEKNGADILTMGAQALALFSAAQDSKKCEEQLSSGSGGSGSGPIVSTAQFCAQPGNASSSTCRCAADPNGAGCLGSLGSGSDVSGFAGFQKGVGNVSGFASTGAPKIADSDIQFDDIPKDIAAKADNGLGATSPFGTGAAAGGGGGGMAAGGGGSGSSKPGAAASEEEKSKFAMGFSSLAKGFGNLFGLKGNDKGGKSLSKEQKEVQLQAIKRKIASDQVRAEISTASGKSNFDKIKMRYTETRSSLISTP